MMMRAVWVTHIPPHRGGGGGHIRQAHLLHALAGVAETELIVAGTLRDDWVRKRLAKVVEVPAQGALDHRTELGRRIFDLRQLLVGRDPREVVENAGLRAALFPALQDALPADLVIVEYAALADLISARGGDSTARWVLTLHNLGSVMGHQAAAFDPARRRRTLFRRDAHLSARYEADIIPRYDQVVAVSERDAAVLRQRAPSGAIDVIPNGVDVDWYRITPLPENPIVLFTGALYTAPNLDGVRWFAEQVVPLIRADRPDVRFVVAGARPPSTVVEICRDLDIELHADVDEMRPLIEQARVAVVPLRIGSGTRLKALEAFAAGRPVVATTVGLEGLEYDPGRHALVADSASEFAEAVTRLLDDRALARRLVAAARTLVEQRYAWQGIAQRFVELVTADGDHRGPTVP